MAKWLVSHKDENGNYKIYKCSACGGTLTREMVFVGDTIFDHLNKCPYCGEFIMGSSVEPDTKHEDKPEEETATNSSLKYKMERLKYEKSVPGIFERYTMDISKYLGAKFPELGEAELMEAVGYISNRTMIVVHDISVERDREWKRVMRQQSTKIKRRDE